MVEKQDDFVSYLPGCVPLGMHVYKKKWQSLLHVMKDALLELGDHVLMLTLLDQKMHFISNLPELSLLGY